MPEARKVNTAIVGLGKMGLSHFAIANALPQIEVCAVCDSSGMLGKLTEKYCKVPFVPDYDRLMQSPELEAVIIATPTKIHERMVGAALARGVNVFCEKPMTLSSTVSAALARQAADAGLVCQVGYHNRFVATFAEAKRLIDLGAIGTVRHVLAEAYGAVVLKSAARTWRNKADQGGGCLYDYAAHPINLMNWYAGRPVDCGGAQLERYFSAEVDDAVYADLSFAGGATGQVSVNWSDETVRKMSTRITIWGSGGRINVDRQEIQIFVGAGGSPQPGYERGWTVNYITDLTPNVAYYLRGEEYSAQIAAFADSILGGRAPQANDFESAADTDFTLDQIRATAGRPREVGRSVAASRPARRSLWRRASAG